MSASTHPTIDQIADHEAGLSSADDAGWIAEHLESCADCREVTARLAEVSDLLSEAGADIPEIPDDVAARIELALGTAAVEREAGVTSLSEHRTDSAASATSEGTRAPSRRSRWVLGAAAAVAVVAIGAAVASNGLPGPSHQADTAASRSNADNESSGAANGGSGQAVTPQGAAAGQGQDYTKNDGPGQRRAPALDSGNVSVYARKLSDGTINGLLTSTPAPCDIQARNAAAPTSGTTALDALVSFEGQHAVLRIQRAQRQLTVYACPGPNRVLYRSTY